MVTREYKHLVSLLADTVLTLLGVTQYSLNPIKNKLEWAELNQAETVKLQVYAKLCFQV